MRLHRDIDTVSDCGGQVASGHELFATDYWCVYCGAKWNTTSRAERIGKMEGRRADVWRIDIYRNSERINRVWKKSEDEARKAKRINEAAGLTVVVIPMATE